MIWHSALIFHLHPQWAKNDELTSEWCQQWTSTNHQQWVNFQHQIDVIHWHQEQNWNFQHKYFVYTMFWPGVIFYTHSWYYIDLICWLMSIWYFCDVNCQHLHIDTKNKISSNIFFNLKFLAPIFFTSGNFLETLLTLYWHHVLMSICYLQFDIMGMSNSGLLMLGHDIDHFCMSIWGWVPTVMGWWSNYL